MKAFADFGNLLLLDEKGKSLANCLSVVKTAILNSGIMPSLGGFTLLDDYRTRKNSSRVANDSHGAREGAARTKERHWWRTCISSTEGSH